MKSAINRNAPFIREIVDRTQDIGGVRISGNNKAEIKENTINLLKAQMANVKSNQNVRKKTH